MKILLNQHLSWKLKVKLTALFDDVKHVKDLGFTEVDDRVIIAWAKDNGYAIVTKDSDYNEIMVNSGPPPIIIWLRMGNCSTRVVEHIFAQNISRILIESNNSESGIISIV